MAANPGSLVYSCCNSWEQRIPLQFVCVLNPPCCMICSNLSKRVLMDLNCTSEIAKVHVRFAMKDGGGARVFSRFTSDNTKH